MSDDLETWLRRRISERLYRARRTIELGNAAEWTELSSGVLVTGEPTDADTWHGTWPMGDSSLTRLMEANDPNDTIARCEAELAILDMYADKLRGVESPPAVTAARWPGAEPEPGMISVRAHEDARRELAALEPVVRLLASGYRHRTGYLEEWKP